MQNEEAPDLCPSHLGILCQAGIDPGNFSLNEVVNLLASSQIGIARVGQSTALSPVAYGGEVNVDEGPHVGPFLAMHDRFFDKRAKF